MRPQVPMPDDGGGGSVDHPSEAPDTNDAHYGRPDRPSLDSDSATPGRPTTNKDHLREAILERLRSLKSDDAGALTAIRNDIVRYLRLHQREHHRLTAADREAIADMIVERVSATSSALQENGGLATRCTPWFSMDDLPSRINSGNHQSLGETALQFVQGLGDLAVEFVEMTGRTMIKQGYIGQDHYYHCMGHCNAASRGPGGELASKLVAAQREATDLAGKSATGHPHGAAFGEALDSFTDTYINRTGYLGGVSGVRCTNHCIRFKPNGMP